MYLSSDSNIPGGVGGRVNVLGDVLYTRYVSTLPRVWHRGCIMLSYHGSPSRYPRRFVCDEGRVGLALFALFRGSKILLSTTRRLTIGLRFGGILATTIAPRSWAVRTVVANAIPVATFGAFP